MSVPVTLPFSATMRDQGKLEESDEDMFTVPDLEEGEEETTTIRGQEGSLQSCNNNNYGGGGEEVAPVKRKRGRNPVDKEYRRLKRLLRNRVSAQQARERKKVYMNELESKAKVLEEKNFKLEEKVSTLVNENNMLRKILMNTRLKGDDNEEAK